MQCNMHHFLIAWAVALCVWSVCSLIQFVSIFFSSWNCLECIQLLNQILKTCIQNMGISKSSRNAAMVTTAMPSMALSVFTNNDITNKLFIPSFYFPHQPTKRPKPTGHPFHSKKHYQCDNDERTKSRVTNDKRRKCDNKYYASICHSKSILLCERKNGREFYEEKPQ